MTAPVDVCEEPLVADGPWLLAGVTEGPGLAAHRRRYAETPRVSVDEIVAATDSAVLRGRGGAAFPFATKLRAAAESGRRPVVVVNLAEGEPASSKDTVLARMRPHLVLDGAVATARALGARQVHVVLPADRPLTAGAVDAAVAERHDPKVRLVRHVASSRFVAGQARAVLELMAGRPNLPVTAWTPEAVDGHRSRPTLLSNAETWAQVGRLLHSGPPRGLGTDDEPGTTLLTVRLGGAVTVREVEFGFPLSALLPSGGDPAVLLGGFHGTWTSACAARRMRISVPGLREAGCSLGAGLVMVTEGCPVIWTQRLVAYLAGESAGRCGPCRFGLPELARAVTELDVSPGTGRVSELASVVERRGACAHPDGTVRLVRSLLAAYPDEVARHGDGWCTWTRTRVERRLRSVAS
ncbi:MAG: NADH-ubiquinone oxidoreductase-F iron-sulfur binding region domain-containing protein [Nocardioides sp.]